MAKGQSQSKFFGHTQWTTNASVLMCVIAWSLATSKCFTFKSMSWVKYRLCKSKYHTLSHMVNTLEMIQSQTAKQAYFVLRLSNYQSNSHCVIHVVLGSTYVTYTSATWPSLWLGTILSPARWHRPPVKCQTDYITPQFIWHIQHSRDYNILVALQVYPSSWLMRVFDVCMKS